MSGPTVSVAPAPTFKEAELLTATGAASGICSERRDVTTAPAASMTSAPGMAFVPAALFRRRLPRPLRTMVVPVYWLAVVPANSMSPLPTRVRFAAPSMELLWVRMLAPEFVKIEPMVVSLASVVGPAQVLAPPTLRSAPPLLMPAPFSVRRSLTVMPPWTSSAAPPWTVVPAAGCPRAVGVVMRRTPKLTEVAPA